MNLILSYTIQFIVGGSIVVGMSILAQHVSPKYAAILYMFPIQFTLAAIFIHIGMKGETIRELAKHSLLYTIGFIVFIAAFYFLTKYFNFWLSLAYSYTLFILITLVIIKFYN